MLIYIYFILTCLSEIHSFTDKKSISLHFSVDYNSLYVQSKPISSLYLNLLSPYSCFVIPEKDSIPLFTPVSSISKKISNENYTFQFYNETLSIGSSLNFTFPFYGVNATYYSTLAKSNKISQLCRNKLSFAYNPPEESVSFMHELYKKEIINKKIFGFDFINKYIYIGDIPSNMTQNITNYYCNIIDDLWGCGIKSVKFNNKIIIGKKNNFTFAKKRRATFSLGTEFITISKEDFDNMINEFLGKEIENNDCYIGHNVYSHEYDNYFMICQTLEFLNKLPIFFDIEFYDFTMIFLTSKMYQEIDGKYKFLIGYKNNSLNEDIDFGFEALINYNVIFDYDKKKIFIYNKGNNTFSTIVSSKEHISAIMKILILNLFNIIFGLVIISFKLHPIHDLF